jgi:hypothetical protein
MSQITNMATLRNCYVMYNKVTWSKSALVDIIRITVTLLMYSFLKISSYTLNSLPKVKCSKFFPELLSFYTPLLVEHPDFSLPNVLHNLNIVHVLIN